VAEVPEESTLEIEIDATTVDTGDATRDGHLRSNDFFGAEDHPTISFRSTGVRPGDGETAWKVDGELTIRGVTRPVTVDLEFLGGPSTLGQPADRLLRRRPRGQPGGLEPDLERPPGDGRVPAFEVGPPRDRGRAGPGVTSTCGTSAGTGAFRPGTGRVPGACSRNRRWIARWRQLLPGRSPLCRSAAPSSSAWIFPPSGRRPRTSSLRPG
jgi:hypothetical protein